MAQDRVWVLPLRDEIHYSSSQQFGRAMDAALADKADLIIVHLDTYGGRIDYADSIRSRLLACPVRTAAFVDRNAASAGALIALACDSIYMAPASTMGAATVVDEHGAAAPDKYQSYWRGVMRATAQANGRDPLIAEKMVDQDLEIAGLSPAGQVITFTNEDAIAHGYSEGTKSGVADVIIACGVSDAQVTYHKASIAERAIDLFNHPVVSALLLVLMFGGIFLELKTAGMGKAGVVAIIAAFFFFVPHYLNGLAETWEVAVFLLGIVLIAMEIFVIPGFGVAGISGILFVVVGVTAALLENQGVDFAYVTLNDMLRTIATVLVLMVTSILLVIWVAKYLVTSKAAYPFVDQSTQEAAEGYTALRPEVAELVGLEAVAVTDLRPVGHIDIDGRQYDAQAGEGYISKGQRVVVERLVGVHLVVRKLVTA